MRSDLHKELQSIARGYAIGKTYWIIGEEVPMPLGICDVWGMSRARGLESIAIEVKVSKQDFRSKSQIFKERNPKPLGDYQYIFCPEFLIYPEEIHEEWGLIWWDGKRVINKKRAPKLDMSAEHKLEVIQYFLHNGWNEKRPKLNEGN